MKWGKNYTNNRKERRAESLCLFSAFLTILTRLSGMSEWETCPTLSPSPYEVSGGVVVVVLVVILQTHFLAAAAAGCSSSRSLLGQCFVTLALSQHITRITSCFNFLTFLCAASFLLFISFNCPSWNPEPDKTGSPAL